MRIPLIVHERKSRWAHQLRSRVAHWPVRLVETRSESDLVEALGRSAHPLLVVDLVNRPLTMLGDLGHALQPGGNALVLVLDPTANPMISRLSREVGATHVLSGSITPPEVVSLLARWTRLARERLAREGWSADSEPGTALWDDLTGDEAHFLAACNIT